ncbi:MAG: glycosyltransferase [Terracidiphilus sp.]
MRIAYLLTSLGIGGAERQVVALAERMASRGHHVALVVIKAPEKHEWPASVEVVRLNANKSFAGLCSAVIRAHRFLRGFRPDLVHSHTFPANMLARMLHILGSAPVVLSTIHNVYEGGWRRTVLYRLTDELSIHTTAVSEAVANRYIQIGAVRRRKCSVVTNGIDLHAFDPARACDSSSTERNDAADDFIWLAAGRMVPAKDFESLLAAFKLVRAEIPQAKLWIAGDLSEERAMRINGDHPAIERPGSNHVRWLGHCENMEETLAACDAFVLSSAWEGMPLVVGEAMAMQKPVVATDVGGVRQLVADAGVIVPPKNPEALAEAMLRVMRMSEDERGTMGKAARERIRQHFDVNAKADEWQALYATLLRDRR